MPQAYVTGRVSLPAWSRAVWVRLSVRRWRVSRGGVGGLRCQMVRSTNGERRHAARMSTGAVDAKRFGEVEVLTAEQWAEQLARQGVLEAGSRTHRLFCGLSDARAGRMVRALSARTRCVTALLDGVHGVHNLAAVCRSCEAFGVQEVHFVPEQIEASVEDGTEPRRRVQRSRSRFLARFNEAVSSEVSRGAHRWLSMHVHDTPEEAVRSLKQHGYTVCVSSLEGGTPVPLHELDWTAPALHRVAFVFGSEGSGVSRAMRDAADLLFTIPMVGFVESLNLSVACATTLAHATAALRQAQPTLYPLTVDERRAVLQHWLWGDVAKGEE